ncbi:hypothetical protein [Bradyrhizobium sp.]|uniref:hypothetical protein n=1 Tax=Bradyrhizobium sp. TaxID=376 RepID=UPI001ED05776|nr:hypothetical protein [Bradyrhizobium sp.]MBV9984512.1 hypothetical protein [Bradyrhizobium sp.]
MGALATSQKDQVRLLIGDTLSSDPQMQDEEINYLLTQRSSVYGAAAECCRSLQAKFSRSVDQATGNTKTSFSQMAKAYGVKAGEFEDKAAMAGAGLPYAGGISIADKLQQEQNADRVSPQFQIGMEDNLLPIPPAGNLSSVPGSTSGG